MALILSSLYSQLNTEEGVVTDVRNRYLLFLNQPAQISKATHASFMCEKGLKTFIIHYNNLTLQLFSFEKQLYNK